MKTGLVLLPGGIIVGILSCNSLARQDMQGSPKQAVNVKSVTLNMPVGLDTPKIVTPAELKHCIVIYKDSFAFTLAGRTYGIKDEAALQDFAVKNRRGINMQMLTLVTSANPRASYKNLVDALDALTIAHIERYQIKEAQ